MEDTRARWERAFVEAVDFDTWGQVEEALEGYQRLQVAAAAEYVENVLQLPVSRRDGIGRLAAALKLRIQELSSSSDKGVGLSTMKTMRTYMKEVIVTDAPFPFHQIKAEGPVTNTQPMMDVMPDDEMEELQDDGMGYSGGVAMQPGGMPEDGTLRPPPQNVHAGETVLTIFIDKWGFKDAGVYVDPRVVVSVRDANGEALEAVQETPLGKANSSYVFFEQAVYIQTPLDRLPPNAAIFFEFKHFKANKGKKSVKAYCFMEMDELRNGPITLEVYKKPAIYTRKRKPNLLSVKPLYLHLGLTLDTLQ